MAQSEIKAGQPEAAAKRSIPSNGATGEASDAVAHDEVSTRRPTSFGRFLRDVLILTVLLGGGIYFYRKHIVTKEEVNKLALAASEKLEKDDLESLKQAEALYKQILDLDGDNEVGVVGLGEAYFYESLHGLETRPQAEQYASEGSGSSPDLLALRAYLKITSNNAQAAESEVKAVLDKGVGSSKLAHALGWAYLEAGNYAQANQVVRAALDTDFNAVRFALTLAEIAHRQGEERAAIRHLRNVMQSSMNPNHEIALAWMAALSAKNSGNITAAAKAIQEVQAKQDKIGPRAKTLLVWAEGELALAMGNAVGAIEKADAVVAQLKGFPPAMDLKARALIAQKKDAEALEVYQAAVKAKPEYRGIKLDLVKLLSERKDDAALALIDELQKSTPGAPGPEFEILRGEHALAKGDAAEAKAAFTRAAELGDDPAILFGMAKVTYLEESKKDKKADLERVAQAFGETLERRATYPEVHDYMGTIALWNFDVSGANASFTEADAQYKKLNRSVPSMVRFYDRVLRELDGVKDKGAKAEAEKVAASWKKKKEEYLGSVLSAAGGGD